MNNSIPVTYKKEPIKVTLTKGERYSFCTCGLSEKSPFCDSSHKEKTDLKSLKFTAEENGDKWLCQCKQTKNPPYCDGSHSKL